MKNRNLISLRHLLLVAIFSISGMTFAQAPAFFNGGGGNAFWSNPDNWLDGMKPNEETPMVSITADVIVDEDVVIRSLMEALPCSLTIQSGNKLTVNEQISWNSGDFILEDGAQLVCQHELDVVVKKKIVAYDEGSHAWEFIASPVINPITPSLENGFLTEPATGFNLIYFDEANRQWVDYSDTPFVIENGRGYAYINALETILLFEGTAQGSAVPVEVSLDYHASNGTVAGCNMVGNPLPCNVFADRSYYTLDDKGTSMLAVAASTGSVIPPCRGIFAKAQSANETISFSKIEDLQDIENQGYVEFVVGKTTAPDVAVDNAIVSFNAGDDLGKFVIFENQPYLYFTKDNHDLAILSIDSAEVIPVKFKAAENTSYTMRVTQKDLNLSYLHLIDNINGNNIDLLASPEYTFTASTSDYASRFKLVFRPDYGVEESVNQCFAYYANGQVRFIGLETGRDALLQIVDMNGHVAWSQAIDGGDSVCNVSALVPGIYVLRLVLTNGVMTQKIVVG